MGSSEGRPDADGAGAGDPVIFRRGRQSVMCDMSPCVDIGPIRTEPGGLPGLSSIVQASEKCLLMSHMPTSSPPWFMPPSAIRPVPPSDHDRCRRGRPPEALLLGKREVPDLFASPSVSHSVVGLRVTQIEIATSERASEIDGMGNGDERGSARARRSPCAFISPQWRKRGRGG